MGKVVKRVCVILAVVLVLVIVAGFFAGNYFFYLALSPDANRDVVTQAEHNRVETDAHQDGVWEQLQTWFDSVSHTDVYMQSFDGLNLHAYRTENEQASNKWAILAHGYGGNGRQMVGSAQQFYAMGFNLLMPDARGCGASEGDYIGMGWHDRLDYVRWIEMLVEEDPRCEIILYGISMGGATVMMVSGEELPQNVKAIVEDCGYSSVRAEFDYQLKSLFGLPTFPIMQFASLVTRLRAGFWLGEGSAVKQVAKSETPMLFIHGTEDTFVPFYMLDEVYEAAACEKEKLVVEGAGHGAASSVMGEAYWQTVGRFVGKYLA